MRIGSRGSSLARVQADHVASLLGGAEVVVIRTSGDAPGSSATDKSRWVDTIEQALLRGEIDIAVHSAKDLPSELAPGLALLGAPSRAPAQDALCGTSSLAELPPGASVGTSSMRRTAQLLAARPDLQVQELKGNVDTRLKRLKAPFDAIVLARAGLQRLAREQDIGALLDPETFVPSPGQGVLALEGRAEDPSAAAAVEAITDPIAHACLRAERELARALQASCNTPLGAWCRPAGDGTLRLCGWVGLPDGSAWIADQMSGEDPEQLAQTIAERMTAAGADEMLAQAEVMAS